MTDRPSTTESGKSDADRLARRRLIVWPSSLAALSLALLVLTQVAAGCGRHHGPHDVDEVKEHAEHVVGHMLYRIDASEEQEERIQAIVAEGIDELAAARGPHEAWRAELVALLTADEVDRDAIETMRRTHIERADAMSAIASRRIADVLDVLTPDQRRELHAKLERRRGRHRGH